MDNHGDPFQPVSKTAQMLGGWLGALFIFSANVVLATRKALVKVPKANKAMPRPVKTCNQW